MTVVRALGMVVRIRTCLNASDYLLYPLELLNTTFDSYSLNSLTRSLSCADEVSYEAFLDQKKVNSVNSRETLNSMK